MSRAVGRRDEVGRIVAALDQARSGAGGRIVELTGEAGIGKSTVLADVEAAARHDGWRVWSAAPTAAESGLPWTGLAQILGAVDVDDRRALVDGHLRQLEGATSAARAEPVSPEVVAFGLAALLDTAAGDDCDPLLLVVDDVQWLDGATAGALAFALRGLPRRRVVALLARRSGEPVPLEPQRLVDADRYQHLELSGLSLASLREIVGEATDLSLGRAELARLHQRTGGNPLYAIQLARSVAPGTSLDDAALPASLGDTVRARLRALPATTRRVLGVAALAARPTIELLTTVQAGVDVLDALGPAESAGVARLRQPPSVGGPPVVVFSHPLLAAAAALTRSPRANAAIFTPRWRRHPATSSSAPPT